MRGLVLATILALSAVGAARAQTSNPPSIRAFDLPTTEALGATIARHDRAAWIASDTLMAKVRDPGSKGLVGWIVVDAAPEHIVRFIRVQEGRTEAGYDVVVTPSGKATLSEPQDRTLTPDELSMFAARQTAASNAAGLPMCRPGYNVVVTRDPERSGWLVWLLAPVPATNNWAIGGHYRFSMSADGRTVLQRDSLSASCMVMDQAAAGVPKGAKPSMFGLNHIVSPTPVETHVFVNLQSGMPMMVGAGGRVWTISGGRIRDAGPIPANPQSK